MGGISLLQSVKPPPVPQHWVAKNGGVDGNVNEASLGRQLLLDDLLAEEALHLLQLRLKLEVSRDSTYVTYVTYVAHVPHVTYVTPRAPARIAPRNGGQ